MKENARLKKLVADLSLDNSILKEASRGNSLACPRDVRWLDFFAFCLIELRLERRQAVGPVSSC